MRVRISQYEENDHRTARSLGPSRVSLSASVAVNPIPTLGISARAQSRISRQPAPASVGRCGPQLRPPDPGGSRGCPRTAGGRTR